MSHLQTFGDPARFAITVGWLDDPEGHDLTPAHGGRSMGSLGLTVGGHVLTRHARLHDERDEIDWYLLPVFEWLAENWVALLHEERFSWRENGAVPAATATFLALRRLIDADDPSGRSDYRTCRTWWGRHALRSADSSALYPDVFLRRLGDDIEMSWTARQPTFAPDGFRLVLEPGVATLPVGDVAGPLWEALAWCVSTASTDTPEDRAALQSLEGRIAALSELPNECLEAEYLPKLLFECVAERRKRFGMPDRSRRSIAAPAIERLDDPVLMFGGVSPEIGRADLDTVLDFLTAHLNGQENANLAAHVDTSVGAPLGAPHEEGYDLAEYLGDDLKRSGDTAPIDIEALLSEWGVTIVHRSLQTRSIRGIALAGEGYAPAILVNDSSLYNATNAGRRFTLAHELFHLLYDRTRARRVAHTSGPWASPAVEKRANAFAAMLLMPRAALRQSLASGDLTRQNLEKAARTLKVGFSALIEHLYNIGFIDVATRDGFRIRSRPSRLC